ncbi:hypothetical protein BCR33DRAFT_747507 [Rhizoclosmatium globosum]|uniref:Uncharacterized protein n=1 Tax=Rhizoclosmatium globosum TaxID=329046 RepID=A0A1Y2ARJ7_9FUNG|nr:hypothetical protein BCR33DRAFT_747507 [Rhizoclosmatium globosum]|eukprot:ORY25198.1 hypothetical protein BCR33DRAFT_747507 [Rhizoclosmatium globosum]
MTGSCVDCKAGNRKHVCTEFVPLLHDRAICDNCNHEKLAHKRDGTTSLTSSIPISDVSGLSRSRLGEEGNKHERQEQESDRRTSSQKGGSGQSSKIRGLSGKFTSRLLSSDSDEDKKPKKTKLSVLADTTKAKRSTSEELRSSFGKYAQKGNPSGPKSSLYVAWVPLPTSGTTTKGINVKTVVIPSYSAWTSRNDDPQYLGEIQSIGEALKFVKGYLNERQVTSSADVAVYWSNIGGLADTKNPTKTVFLEVFRGFGKNRTRVTVATLKDLSNMNSYSIKNAVSEKILGKWRGLGPDALVLYLGHAVDGIHDQEVELIPTDSAESTEESDSIASIASVGSGVLFSSGTDESFATKTKDISNSVKTSSMPKKSDQTRKSKNTTRQSFYMGDDSDSADISIPFLAYQSKSIKESNVKGKQRSYSIDSGLDANSLPINMIADTNEWPYLQETLEVSMAASKEQSLPGEGSSSSLKGISSVTTLRASQNSDQATAFEISASCNNNATVIDGNVELDENDELNKTMNDSSLKSVADFMTFHVSKRVEESIRVSNNPKLHAFCWSVLDSTNAYLYASQSSDSIRSVSNVQIPYFTVEEIALAKMCGVDDWESLNHEYEDLIAIINCLHDPVNVKNALVELASDIKNDSAKKLVLGDIENLQDMRQTSFNIITANCREFAKDHLNNFAMALASKEMQSQIPRSVFGMDMSMEAWETVRTAGMRLGKFSNLQIKTLLPLTGAQGHMGKPVSFDFVTKVAEGLNGPDFGASAFYFHYLPKPWTIPPEIMTKSVYLFIFRVHNADTHLLLYSSTTNSLIEVVPPAEQLSYFGTSFRSKMSDVGKAVQNVSTIHQSFVEHLAHEFVDIVYHMILIRSHWQDWVNDIDSLRTKPINSNEMRLFVLEFLVKNRLLFC